MKREMWAGFAEGTHEVLTALLVTLIVLRVADLIGLSWWWVLAPFWVPLLLAVARVVWVLQRRSHR